MMYVYLVIGTYGTVACVCAERKITLSAIFTSMCVN